MFHSELLWSLMAPVDISHQGCLIKINNLHLSVRCDGRLGTLNVHPAHSAYATWQQDFKSCATTGITQVLYSSWGFSNDLLARNNHPALENARFVSPFILMRCCVPQGPQQLEGLMQPAVEPSWKVLLCILLSLTFSSTAVLPSDERNGPRE